MPKSKPIFCVTWGCFSISVSHKILTQVAGYQLMYACCRLIHAIAYNKVALARSANVPCTYCQNLAT
ncbi:hypothetical protein LC605_32620 [Nostoc sp. CHAB 5836]|uniref:hypothetical protein n=1 Tax=Nostoc sp. CHAB 5836 TaxID=2780404 RepID=UPI001E2FF880|nr:hypothetical protein [Nostoc sp. CHAB 5836]MCC5619688.1 hypothetical protein [Nostoc sp. CHAB 5836]